MPAVHCARPGTIPAAMSMESKKQREPRRTGAKDQRVRRGTITDPEAKRTAIRDATSRIKTNARLDFVRSIRGR